MTTQPFQSHNGETLLTPVLIELETRSHKYASFHVVCGEIAYNVELRLRYVCRCAPAQVLQI